MTDPCGHARYLCEKALVGTYRLNEGSCLRWVFVRRVGVTSRHIGHLQRGTSPRGRCGPAFYHLRTLFEYIYRVNEASLCTPYGRPVFRAAGRGSPCHMGRLGRLQRWAFLAGRCGPALTLADRQPSDRSDRSHHKVISGGFCRCAQCSLLALPASAAAATRAGTVLRNEANLAAIMLSIHSCHVQLSSTILILLALYSVQPESTNKPFLEGFCEGLSRTAPVSIRDWTSPGPLPASTLICPTESNWSESKGNHTVFRCRATIPS